MEVDSVLLVYSIHDRLFSSTPIRICTHPRTLGTTLCYDLETLCVRNIDILLRTYFTSYGCSTQVKDYIIPFLGLRLCGITISPFLNSDWGHSGGIWRLLVLQFLQVAVLRFSLYFIVGSHNFKHGTFLRKMNRPCSFHININKY